MIINHSSHIQLSKKALEHNVAFIRKTIDPDTVLSAVVKGNAYGHGINQMVPALQEIGVKHFSVFSAYEAKLVYEVLDPESELMIMGDIPDEDTEWVVERGIDFFAYNFYEINHFLKEAKKQQKKIKIHIELETGMHRHGFDEEQWPTLIELIKENRNYIELKGMCTHFAGAESSSNFKRIEKQQVNFLKGVKRFQKAGLEPERLHTSCSAAILAFPEWNMDMVRVGILHYGLWPSKESELIFKLNHPNRGDLSPVLSWHSSVMEIKNVKVGEYIGYGTSYLAERDMKIASVPVGYSYGFSRKLSNAGRVLVKGKRLSVIGVVNMNMFLIDVTEIDAEIGDKVTLIGKDGGQEIKVSYFGNLSNQLNYELLSRLDKSIPRSFKGG